MRASWLLPLVFLLGSPGMAQEPADAVTVTDIVLSLQGPLQPEAGSEGAPATPIRIGDRVPFLLIVELGAEHGIGDIQIAEDTDDFAVLTLEPPTEVPLADGGRRLEVPVSVVPFKVGELEFPGVVVPWQGPGGAGGEARSATAALVVEALVDPESAAALDPEDIRGVAEMDVRRLPVWLLWLALLLAAVALLLWWRRRPRVRETAPEVIPDPFGGLAPDRWALRAIDRLLTEKVLERQGTEVFHVRLAEIARLYLEGRFGIETLERTTTEILTGVEAIANPLPGPRGRLRQLLSDCDLVKFARLQPTAGEAVDLAATARSFVEETAPATAMQESA